MAEGFLEITRILINSIEVYPTTNSISAHSGDNIIIAIYIKNIGAIDNFYCEIRDLDTYQTWGVQDLYNFSAGKIALIPKLGDFSMPNRNLNLAVISYHDELGSWIWDDSHSFVISLIIIAEGFLDILGVDILPYIEIHAGDTATITVHTKNTGASDDFKVEMVGDFISSTEFYLIAGLTKDVSFSFIMPDKDISLTINTYHYEPEVGWVWDSTSVWELLFEFMNIKDRPYKR